MGRVLDRIKGEGVVSFKLREDKKTIRVKEQCDHYFIHLMDKAEFGEMIDELQDLHDQMKDG